MLYIKNLSLTINATDILKDVNLSLAPGTVHALMGPNGSGKSSLAYALMGHPAYVMSQGSIYYNNHDIGAMAVDARARLGFFLAFQYPYEIPGVSILTFLHESYNARMGTPMPISQFKELLYAKMDILKIDHAFEQRAVHEHFSGGQKKRLEMLQLLLLNPNVAILDEIDSGLDVDALKIVSVAIQAARAQNPAMILLIITHYQRILQYVIPDQVHVICAGSIVQTGTHQLALQIEQQGYNV